MLVEEVSRGYNAVKNTAMDHSESLERARAELEMIQAAYPDEITVPVGSAAARAATNPPEEDDGNGNDHAVSFPFRFTLHLSNRASLTMELDDGYPEDSPVLVTNFRADRLQDKARLDQIVRAVRTVADECQADGMEGAISCCAVALETWRDDDNDYDNDNHNDNGNHGGEAEWADEDNVRTAGTVAPSFPHPATNKTYHWMSGEPLMDRKSSFQAHLCWVRSVQQVQEALPQLLQSSSKMQRATHHIYAWRFSEQTKDGRVLVQHDNDDDGEDGAGSKLAYLLDMRQDDGVLVVVSRWYGGIHLGPKRFAHIVSVARELLSGARNKRL